MKRKTPAGAAIDQAASELRQTIRMIPQEYDPAIPIADIRAWDEDDGNPNEGDRGALSVSIDDIGFFGAIGVQWKTPKGEDRRRICYGHGRYEKFIEKGETTIPGFKLICSDRVARKILLAENRIARLGHDNPAKLLRVLDRMAADGGMLGSGFDEDDRQETRRLVEGPDDGGSSSRDGFGGEDTGGRIGALARAAAELAGDDGCVMLCITRGQRYAARGPGSPRQALSEAARTFGLKRRSVEDATVAIFTTAWDAD